MGKEGKPKAGPGSKVVTDSRFAAVHHDPRFQRFPKAKAKVEIDDRFAGEWLPPLLAGATAPATTPLKMQLRACKAITSHPNTSAHRHVQGRRLPGAQYRGQARPQGEGQQEE